MKALRNLAVLGLIGWIVWKVALQQGPGDRPPILIANGPVRIEVQPDGSGPARFQKGLLGIGDAWYLHHHAHTPSHFGVVVADSTCGPQATYDTTELTVTSGGGERSSMVTISVAGVGPLAYLEIKPHVNTTLTHDPMVVPEQIQIGHQDDRLEWVRIGTATCAFIAGEGSITVTEQH